MSLETLSIGLDAVPHPTEMARSGLPARYVDCRPSFLNLSSSALKHSKDHEARPVVLLTEPDRLPWCSGYAETINGGKSAFTNEDHACYGFERLEVFVTDAATGEEKLHYIELWYFGVFDGHAGAGASIFSSKNLHRHVIGALKNIGPLLVKEGDEVFVEEATGPLGPPCPPVTKDSLIQGTLEQAFIDMDSQIKRERATYNIPGGCTAIAAVFVLGKLYVANAGDSRSIICREAQPSCASCLLSPSSEHPPPLSADATAAEAAAGDPAKPATQPCSLEVVEVSHDFTPETDRTRLQYLAMLQPKLLRGLFGRLQWQRRLRKRDLDKRVMCRDAHMQGWVYRSVTEEDLNYAPMLTGEGKRARLLGTIGTSRGFGDHDLLGPGDIHIKPFLTAAPQVIVYDISSRHHSPNDVLVMATDGLWERLNNEEAKEVAEQCLSKQPLTATGRYITLAQQLVLAARGNLTAKGWRTASDEQGSYDDISIFIIPLGKCPFNPPPPSAAPTATTTFTSADETSPETSVDGVAQDPADTSATAPAAVIVQAAPLSTAGPAKSRHDARDESPDDVTGSTTSSDDVITSSSERQELAKSLSPRDPAALSSISPNLSIDSDMVVLDSITTRTTPSVGAGRGEAIGEAAAEVDHV